MPHHGQIVDHGELLGLADDDHTQYARGQDEDYVIWMDAGGTYNADGMHRYFPDVRGVATLPALWATLKATVEAEWGTGYGKYVYLPGTYLVPSDLPLGRHAQAVAREGATLQASANLTNGIFDVDDYPGAGKGGGWLVEGFDLDLNSLDGHAVYTDYAASSFGHKKWGILRNYVSGLKAAYVAFRLLNPMNGRVADNRTTGGGGGVSLEGVVGGINWGNTELVGNRFGGLIGINLQGQDAGNHMNMITGLGNQCLQGDAVGSRCLRLEWAYWNTLLGCDFEDAEIGVYGVNDVYENTIQGHYNKSMTDLAVHWDVGAAGFARGNVIDFREMNGANWHYRDDSVARYNPNTVKNVSLNDERITAGKIYLGHNTDLESRVKNYTSDEIALPFRNTVIPWWGVDRRTINPHLGEAAIPTSNEEYLANCMDYKMYISGGTVTAIVVKSVPGAANNIFHMATTPCNVTVRVGEVFKILYTVDPTFVVAGEPI